MQRIIDGKRYNTETATLVASESYGYKGDFRYWDEDLYRTPRGRWFIWGEGGPMSRWARSTGQNSWCGGQGILALSEAEALAWCEQHRINPDTIARHFTVEDA